MRPQAYFRTIVLVQFALSMSVVSADEAHEKVQSNVLSATVMVGPRKDRLNGVGVLASDKGYVLFEPIPVPTQDEIVVSLSGKRIVEATVLGWSEEWNLAIAKLINAERLEFEPARLRTSSVDRDETFFISGYSLESNGWSESPNLRELSVTRLGGEIWFGSEPLQERDVNGTFTRFGPAFDNQGRLVGLLGARGNIQSAFLHGVRIGFLIKLVESGKRKNLDLVDDGRFKQEERGRPYTVLATPLATPASEAKQSALASAVRIFPSKGGQSSSGVIISADGYVVTCGHGYDEPGGRVTVKSADGREADGEFLGVNPISDIALLKIIGKRKWPFSSLSDDTGQLKESTSVWFMGYPAKQNEDVQDVPLVRTMTIVVPDNGSHHVIYTEKAVAAFGGDSGGGLFDLNGRLLAVHQGYDSDGSRPGRHTHIKTLRNQWPILVKSNSAATRKTRPEPVNQ